jgi:PPOX class probable F420-dependent enzyme
MIDLTSKFGRKVQRHLKADYFIWFTTVGRDLTPQPRPVWFIWEHDSFLIYSQPGARKVQHLKANPNVALHFNADELGENEVIVFIGTAVINPNELPAHKMSPYLKKYRGGIKALGSTPDQLAQEYSVAIRVTPISLRGW